jgi:MerR family transcriptional regulator, light-induced transcriptional regulator
VLLPGLEAMAADGGDTGPEYGFGWRWATGWLAASMRCAPSATRQEGILIFDASRPIDVDSLHAQALELVLRRGGLRTLTLTTELDPDRVSRALHALDPRAVVLTGKRASLDTLGRLVFAARRVGADRVTVFDYRGALPETGASTVERLGDKPIAARDLLIDHLEDRVAAAPAPSLRVAKAV